ASQLWPRLPGLCGYRGAQRGTAAGARVALRARGNALCGAGALPARRSRDRSGVVGSAAGDGVRQRVDGDLPRPRAAARTTVPRVLGGLWARLDGGRLAWIAFPPPSAARSSADEPGGDRPDAAAGWQRDPLDRA